jgi:hypothetical protein
MTTPMLGRQRQVDQRLDRPVGAQQRLGQLEQRIGPGGQTAVKVGPESGQYGQWIDTGMFVQQTHPHGLGSDHERLQQRT